MQYLTCVSVVFYLFNFSAGDASGRDERTRYFGFENLATTDNVGIDLVPCGGNGDVKFVSMDIDVLPVGDIGQGIGQGKSEQFNFTMGFIPSSTQSGLNLEVEAFLEGSTNPVVVQSIEYKDNFQAFTTYFVASSFSFGATVPVDIHRMRWYLKSSRNEALLCQESVASLILASNTGTSINDPCTIWNVPCSFPNSNCDSANGGKCSCNAASINVNGVCMKTIGTYCLSSSDACIDNASCKRLSGNVVSVCECNTGYTMKETTEVCYNGSAKLVMTGAYSKLLLLVISAAAVLRANQGCK